MAVTIVSPGHRGTLEVSVALRAATAPPSRITAEATAVRAIIAAPLVRIESIRPIKRDLALKTAMPERMDGLSALAAGTRSPDQAHPFGWLGSPDHVADTHGPGGTRRRNRRSDPLARDPVESAEVGSLRSLDPRPARRVRCGFPHLGRFHRCDPASGSRR